MLRILLVTNFRINLRLKYLNLPVYQNILYVQLILFLVYSSMLRFLKKFLLATDSKKKFFVEKLASYLLFHRVLLVLSKTSKQKTQSLHFVGGG